MGSKDRTKQQGSPMDTPKSSTQHAIAVISMAAYFPEAGSLSEYWQNIIDGRDCIRDVPESHWRIEDYYDPDPTKADKTYCKRGGFLPPINFDPLAFGLPPNMLEVTDSSQLLSLVLARQLLNQAGYGSGSNYQHDRTGVILGVTGPQKLSIPLANRLQYPVWRNVLLNSGIDAEEAELIVDRIRNSYINWDEDAMPGFLGNVIAGRIANRLNLGGINSVVDAACASSLGALKMAISELLEHRCDLMISGGVDTDASIFQYIAFSKTPAFSAQSHPRPFDQSADGMVPGEGIGLVLLKRLEDAERDGDRIYAVIRGIGASSDGKHTSIYAPLPAGQARALEQAYQDAGFPAHTVGLIEAHGTGTVAGDQAEFSALQHIFQQGNGALQQTALGSVKSQIGHTKAAAGAAGLIKAILALHHKVLPPTLHIDQPNPKLNIEESAFYLNTETRPWIRGEHPRRAGVSSFGFGGTNYHVVLEEYQAEHEQAYRHHQGHAAIVLHGITPQVLLNECRTQLDALHGPQAEQAFRALAEHDLTIPREHARLGFVASKLEEAAKLLQIAIQQLSEQRASSWQHPQGVYYRERGLAADTPVAVLFPGQGSQYLNMGKELALNYPEVRERFAQLDALRVQQGAEKLSTVVFPIPTFDKGQRDSQSQYLQQTNNAQPAIGALSASMYQLLLKAGLQPSMVGGHSFGEFTALWAGGVFDDATFLQIIQARGQAMHPPREHGQDIGTMLAVQGDLKALAQHAVLQQGDVWLANDNAPDQVVLAGSHQAIQQAQQLLRADGYQTTQLPVAAAYHSPLIEYAYAPLKRQLDQLTYQKPQIPVYSNSTATAYPSDSAEIRVQLEQHMLQSVRFREQIEQMYADGARIFIECGPRNVLSNLVHAILPQQEHYTVALNPQRQGDSSKQLRQALVQLVVLGQTIGLRDPYQLVEAASDTKVSRTSIMLNGTNYISEPTKQLMQQAQHQFIPMKHSIPSSITKDTPPSPPVEIASQAITNRVPQAMLRSTPEHLLHLAEHQAQTQQSHEQFVQQQQALTQTILQTVQQLTQALSQGAQQQVALLQQTLQLLQDQQALLVRSHEQYLQSRSEYTRLGFQYANEPVSVVQYPAEVPQTRYEAVATPIAEPTFTSAPVTVAEPVAVEAVAKPAPTPPAPVAPAQNTLSISPVQNTPNVAPADATSILMDIISAKTGYPVDILEPSMDLESDLGIDSIKRVQILSTLAEQYPDRPQPAPGDLAHLRTIAAIAEYISSDIPAAPAQSVEPQVVTVPTKIVEPPAAIAPTPSVSIPNEPSKTNGVQLATNQASPALLSSGLSQQAVITRHLPPPDYLNSTLSDQYCGIIVSDGTILTTTLADALSKHGWHIVLLEQPERPTPAKQSYPSYTLYSLQEDAIQQLLSLIQQRHGLCGALLYLHPPAQAIQQASDLFDANDEALVRSVFLLAKHLAEPLNSLAQSQRTWFCTISQTDGTCGLGPQAFSAIGSGLVGLTKALNLEWEQVFCRSIDLDQAQSPEQQVEQILHELYDPNRVICEVGYADDNRITLVSE
jgi:acyl transferase domain-containing protein